LAHVGAVRKAALAANNRDPRSGRDRNAATSIKCRTSSPLNALSRSGRLSQGRDLVTADTRPGSGTSRHPRFSALPVEPDISNRQPLYWLLVIMVALDFGSQQVAAQVVDDRSSEVLPAYGRFPGELALAGSASRLPIDHLVELFVAIAHVIACRTAHVI
jgi:hypothetical protein